jgi:hypothetical protein
MFRQPERQYLDDRFFQPGEYVYERMISDIEHCHEHIEALRSRQR